jgi:hypothetical protein
MKLDPGTIHNIEEGLSALSRTADTYYTAAVDHGAKGPAVTFFLSCGTFDTSLAATVQHSDDNSTWTDEADTTAGNEVSATLGTVGTIELDVPNPRARYSRLKVVLGGTCVIGVTSVSGPKRFVDEG